MTIPPLRVLVAGLALATVAVLLAWQQHRVKLIAACTADAGIWDGRTSKCLPARPSPILQRDLRRT